MSNTVETILKQILQRVTRTETRLMKLSEAQGVEVKGDNTPPKLVFDTFTFTVNTHGLDVTIADVIRCAVEGGVHDDWVDVFYLDRRVGEVFIEGGVYNGS